MICTTQTPLNRYIVDKHQERIFSCKICGQTFEGRKDALNRHIVNKPQERTFSWEICGQTFGGRKDALNRYIVDKHQKRIISCEISGQTFGGRKDALKRHLRVHKVPCAWAVLVAHYLVTLLFQDLKTNYYQKIKLQTHAIINATSYVNDIIAVFHKPSHVNWSETRLQRGSVLKFTHEDFPNNHVHFLDISFSIEENRKFTTSVFIKPADNITHFNFNSYILDS